MRLKIRKSRMVIELAMIGNQQAMAKTWLMITMMMMMMASWSRSLTQRRGGEQ